jgi:membrane protein implicated in regulation of membrane protease activity
MAFFIWVAGASPWLWLALGIVLLALEILVPNFVLAWPGLAAIAMALLVWLMPGLSGQALVALFALLSIILLVGGRTLMAKAEKNVQPSGLNARVSALVGRDAKVVEVDGPEGKVELDGIRWPATWAGETPEIGQRVTITKAAGAGVVVT